MLKADLSDDALTSCYRAAQRVLKRFGERNQNGDPTYSPGNLRFAHTSVNKIEIRLIAENVVVLSVPVDLYPGYQKDVIWQPAPEWVQLVDAIDQCV